MDAWSANKAAVHLDEETPGSLPGRTNQVRWVLGLDEGQRRRLAAALQGSFALLSLLYPPTPGVCDGNCAISY